MHKHRPLPVIACGYLCLNRRLYKIVFNITRFISFDF